MTPWPGAGLGIREKMAVSFPSLPPGHFRREENLKPGKRKKNRIGEPFAPLLKAMVKSVAYKKLSNPARTAYTLLLCQCSEPGQREVIFPYSHAEDYMNRHTFARAIRQLCELGFIEKSDFGGLYRRTNVYRFTEDWRQIR